MVWGQSRQPWSRGQGGLERRGGGAGKGGLARAVTEVPGGRKEVFYPEGAGQLECALGLCLVLFGIPFRMVQVLGGGGYREVLVNTGSQEVAGQESRPPRRALQSGLGTR